jgi:methylenetetrahydrofolate dehydrogenase (NADP+)/methenyltetrahydrofolate cyclohydrolase
LWSFFYRNWQFWVSEEVFCMLVLKGSEAAARIKKEVQEMVEGLGGHVPTAAIVRVGERPDDLSYERNVMKKIASFGMEARSFAFPESIREGEFQAEFQKINDDPSIDGILLFCPLPRHMNGRTFEELIRPEKDLDGISPVNRARIFAGEKDGFAPCTAEAVIEILKTYQIPMEGKRAVVVGRSMVVGRPLSMLFLKENATVTVCHTKTADLKAVCREADILVAAAGKAGMISGEFVKPGAVVADVGINVDENGALKGDVEWDGLEAAAAAAATPVPGGVGSVTTAVLCRHLAEAAMRKYGAEQAQN